MKKVINILSIAFCLFMTVHLVAQDAEFRVISSQGDVKHKTKDGEIVENILAGSKLAAEGTLIVEDSSEVKIICRDKPHFINQAGMYDLEELFSKTAKKSMSFTGRFWKFIMEGLTKSDSKDDIKKYHQNYMSVSGGVKGYTTNDNGLIIHAPFAGKIISSNLEMAWDSEQEGPYSIQLYSASERELLFQAESNETEFRFSSDLFELTPGYDYYLKIQTSEGGYDEIFLQMVNMNEERISRRLNSLVDYESATDSEKQWMRAVVLEMEGFQNEANSIYQTLIKNAPEDGFLHKNYLLFLTRNNQLETVNSML